MGLRHADTAPCSARTRPRGPWAVQITPVARHVWQAVPMAVFSLRLVRVWIPVGMVLLGLLLWLISPDIVGLEGFALLLGGAAGIAVSNTLHRMSISGESDRVGESDARVFLDRYGVWPDAATPEQLREARASGLFDGRGLPTREPARPSGATGQGPSSAGSEAVPRPADGSEDGRPAPSRPVRRRPGPHDSRR